MLNFSKACLDFIRPSEAGDYKIEFSSYIALAHHHSAEPPTTLSTNVVGYDWNITNGALSESGIAHSNQHLPTRKAS
jgi:hypothetical protein